MSGAEAALAAAVGAAMAAAEGLAGVLNPPGSRAMPAAEPVETLATDWGTKDATGREVRLAVTLRDAGPDPGRLRALAGGVEAAVAALPRRLGGWRLGSVAFVRTRLAAEGPGRWVAVVEHRVRMIGEGAA